MDDLGGGGDIQPYEDDNSYSNYIYPLSGRYTRFNDRFRYALPPYVFQEMIGLSPQRRRAFLLQQKYLTALSFDYAILEVMKKSSQWLLFIGLLRFMWDLFLNQHKVVSVLLILIFLLLFFVFRWQQSSNTRTIREEVVYQFVSDGISVILALLVSFSGTIHTYLP